MMKDATVDIENKYDLLCNLSIRFVSADKMLEAVGIDQNTFYSHINNPDLQMNIDTVQEIVRVVGMSEPRFQFEDPDEYIEVPEENGWGSGRISLEDDFREFMFGRRLFDPLSEQLLEDISGFSRMDMSNYRNEDRWIPEDGYRELFNYFREALDVDTKITFDIYQRNEEEKYFEEVSFDQFAEHFVEMEDFPKLRNKNQIALNNAKNSREQLDSRLREHQVELDEYEGYRIKNDIINGVFQGDRELTAEKYKEKNLNALYKCEVLDKLDENTYWIKV